MLTNNSTIFREISDLRLQLSGLDSNSKSEKLAKYIQIFEKSSLLDDYSLKLDDVTHIVKLALELNEFEIVHKYCNKVYKDSSIDKLSFYKFQGQAYEAQEDFQSAFATFNKASKIYDNDEVLNSLGRVLKKIESKFERADGIFYQLCVQGGAVINAQGNMNDYVEARIRLNKKYKSKESKPIRPNSYESPSSSSQPLRKYRSDQIQSAKSTSRELFTTLELSTPQRLPTTPESAAPVVEGDLIFSDFPAQGNQQIPNHHQAFDEYGGVGFRRALSALQTSNEFTTPSSSSIAMESPAPVVEGDLIFSDFPAQGNQRILGHQQKLDDSGDFVNATTALFESMISEGVKKLAQIKEDDANSLKKMIEECEERLKNASQEDKKEIEKELLELRKKQSALEKEQVNQGVKQGKLEIRQGKLEIRQDKLEVDQHSLEKRVKTLEEIRIDRIGRLMTMDQIMAIFKSEIKKLSEEESLFSQDSLVVEDSEIKRNKDRDEFYEKKIEEIKQNELYSDYYSSLVSELNSLYFATMVVKNDVIKTNESEKYQKIAAYLKVLYSFIPIVGPLVEGFVDVVALTIDKCKDILTKEKMERFAQLAEGVGEFEQISLRLAINLMDYDEIKKRSMSAIALLGGSNVRDAIFSRINGQIASLGNDDEVEFAKCNSRWFELAKNTYLGSSEKIGSVLGRLDAIRIIALIQEKEFVKNILDESQEKKSNGDIRRVKSIIAESIVEKYKRKQTPDHELSTKKSQIQVGSQRLANQAQRQDNLLQRATNQIPEALMRNDRSRQERVSCLSGMKKSITKCLGV